MEGHNQVYKELAGIVGSKYVSDDDFTLLSYTRDCGTYTGKPQGFVVRPGCTQDVVELVRYANQTRTPLIPMGGKATVLGVPPGQPGRGILVDMRRMSKVIEIDEENMTVTAECGITLGELSGILNAKGYDIHTAAMPHYPDTVGGHISGVPGGGYGAYGTCMGWNWHYILGFKVVLPDASVIETGTGPGSSTADRCRQRTWARSMEGPDTTGLFIGDGGIFGIKTEVTERYFFAPKFKKGGARSWDTLDDAYKVYHKLHEIDNFLYMQPYGFGCLFDPDTLTLATMGMAEPKWTIAYNVIGNTEEEVDFKQRMTDKAMKEGGGQPGNKAAVEFMDNYVKLTRDMGKMSTFGKYTSSPFEPVVSRRYLLEAYKWEKQFIEKGMDRKGIDRSKIHWTSVIITSGPGFGMVSFIAYFDPTDPVLVRKVHELNQEGMEEAQKLGYIQGASQGYAAPLRMKWYSPQLYNYLLTLKRTLDPNNIMNPGLYFP